jgi:hypothetical protein
MFDDLDNESFEEIIQSFDAMIWLYLRKLRHHILDGATFAPDGFSERFHDNLQGQGSQFAVICTLFALLSLVVTARLASQGGVI